MSVFGQNLLAFAKKNQLSGTDVCRHFGWHSNAYRNYTVDGTMPVDDNWHQIVVKTGVPKSEWIYSILTEDELPTIKFYSALHDKRQNMVEDDEVKYGELIKIDTNGLLQKIADLELRLEAVENAMRIAKE